MWLGISNSSQLHKSLNKPQVIPEKLIMRKRGFHILKRLRIRQSWNKYNLYNLAREVTPNTKSRTFFQQKWTAKALTRAYHGETILEKHWKRMFRPTLRSVVPMNHKELAEDDGAKQAMGRGSGLDRNDPEPKKGAYQTPYMNMLYAPAERRLDTAIFRALFASSTRQARQFVVHGYVRVNGKVMIYPGYQLNPGDMFQVEPERVMFATGAPKDAEERRATRLFRRKQKKANEDPSPPETEPPSSSDPAPAPPESESPAPLWHKDDLQDLLARAKSILEHRSDDLRAKRKKDLRALQKILKRNLSRSTTLSDSIDAQILELTSRLNLSPTSSPPASSSSPPTSPAPPPPGVPAALGAADRALLRAAIAEAQENPVDPSKPYATPWRPRDYMSAFAFIPRYLEVHHRICSAVYVRHPVARPGLAEIPTPYATETNALAYIWYLRRR